jgi:DnaJ homolog subfamily C member 19
MRRVGTAIRNALMATQRTSALGVHARNYHMSRRAENDLVVGGIALGVTAMGLSKVLEVINSMPAKAVDADAESSDGKDAAATSVDGKDGAVGGEGKGDAKKKAAASSSAFGWFSFGKNFYEGGFEDKMTKREAALILGVRETTTADRIKASHRKILILNHPDRGGSSYIAAKVNEAKDMLMKGKD